MSDFTTSVYYTYAKWCEHHGKAVPTLEQWFQQVVADQSHQEPHQDTQREIDRERREGWAYGESR